MFIKMIILKILKIIEKFSFFLTREFTQCSERENERERERERKRERETV